MDPVHLPELFRTQYLQTIVIVIEDSDDEPPARTNNILRIFMSGMNMTTTNNVEKDGISEPETVESMSYIQENEDDARYVPSQNYLSGSFIME